jgi:hypothetical protein
MLRLICFQKSHDASTKTISQCQQNFQAIQIETNTDDRS